MINTNNNIGRSTMSQVIRIPESLYKRLESFASGFDTPANVIERLLDLNESKLAKTNYPTLQDDNYIAHEKSKRRIITAKGRLHRELNNETYKIICPNGKSQIFYLPEKNNKEGIKKLTDEVLEFVKEQECTKGQINSARKKLTEAGYLIEK